MDAEQVKIALSVAKNKSFSTAAKETAYAQSTVSKRIISLEKELGMRLFERKARAQVVLTEEGEQLLPFFENIDQAYDRLTERVALTKSEKSQHLTIGCLNGLSTFGEDDLILRYSTASPTVRIMQTEGTTSSLVSGLESHQIDAAFLVFISSDEYPELKKKSLEYQDLWSLRLKIALSKSHPCANLENPTLTDFCNETFLFRDFHKEGMGDSKIQRFVNACRQEGFEPDIQLLDSRTSMAFGMVAAQRGVAPLMYRPKTLRQDVIVKQLAKDYYRFNLKIVYRADDNSPALRSFLSYAERFAGRIE